MATKKKAPLAWTRCAASTEGSPIVVADMPTFVRRAGNVEGAAEYVDIDDGAVLLDTEGGGPADVAFNDDELIVLLASGDFEDAPKKLAKLVKGIEGEKYTEYLVGTIAIAGDLVVDDSASAGDEEPAFTVPRKAGTYVVVEGHYDDDGEARWCRIMAESVVAARRKKYAKRPTPAPVDPVEEELAGLSFDTPKEEAWALEAALRIVELGRPDIALEICAKASSARRALASWTRVLALAAQGDEAAAKEATALAEEWLRPADSAEHANQVLPRAHILRALDAAGAPELRARVVSAPEPDVFMSDAGGDFF